MRSLSEGRAVLISFSRVRSQSLSFPSSLPETARAPSPLIPTSSTEQESLCRPRRFSSPVARFHVLTHPSDEPTSAIPRGLTESVFASTSSAPVWQDKLRSSTPALGSHNLTVPSL